MVKNVIICSVCGEVAERFVNAIGKVYWRCVNPICRNVNFTYGTPASNNATEYYDAAIEKMTKCPHCGEEDIIIESIMEDVTGYRRIEMDVNGDWERGELYLGEEVPDKYRCLYCGHEEDKLEAFIQEKIQPIACPPTETVHTGADVYDVIEHFIEVVCTHCPNYRSGCMPGLDEEGDNYLQMLNCISNIKGVVSGQYPTPNEIIPFEK